MIWLEAVVVILLAGAVSVAGLIIVRRFVIIPISDRHNDVAGYFFAAIGVVYAVMLAFVVFTVWDRFNTVDDAVTRESADLVMVFRDTQTFPEPQRDQAQNGLRAYAHEVMDVEWKEHGKRIPHDTPDPLNVVWDAYRAVQPPTPLGQNEMADASSRLHALELDRHLRHLSVEATLPTVYWLLLIGGGIVTVIFTYLFNMESRWTQAAMTATLAGMIAGALFLIFAMNYPFTGPVSVNKYPLQHALEQFNSLNLPAR